MRRGIKPRQTKTKSRSLSPPPPLLRPARSLSRPLARSPQPRHAVEERDTQRTSNWGGRSFLLLLFWWLVPAILIASAAVGCLNPSRRGPSAAPKAKGTKKEKKGTKKEPARPPQRGTFANGIGLPWDGGLFALNSTIPRSRLCWSPSRASDAKPGNLEGSRESWRTITAHRPPQREHCTG